jgi:hypothetical protein
VAAATSTTTPDAFVTRLQRYPPRLGMRDVNRTAQMGRGSDRCAKPAVGLSSSAVDLAMLSESKILTKVTMGFRLSYSVHPNRL